MSQYIPERGDIIKLDLSPTRGHEQSGFRPALVLSVKKYNTKTRRAVICPITSKNHEYAFHVPVDVPKIKGFILVDQVRAIDYKARDIEYASRIEDDVLAEVIKSFLCLFKDKIMQNKNNIAPVKLSEPQADWVERFEAAKAELEPVIGGSVKSIEHMGSTSIPGIAAKSEIDILVGVDKLEDVEPLIEPLKQIGYPYYKRFEENTPNRRYFRKSEGITPLVHVHMYEIESDAYKKHIFFRDYLRLHPETAKAYEDLKKELLILSDGDRGMYQEGKKKFIDEVVQRTI